MVYMNRLILKVLYFMMLPNCTDTSIRGSPDETQTLRYKLVTLPKGTTKIPKVEFGIPSISVNQNSGEVSLTPTTSPPGNSTTGYTVVLLTKIPSTVVGSGLQYQAGSVPVFLGDEVTTT